MKAIITRKTMEEFIQNKELYILTYNTQIDTNGVGGFIGTRQEVMEHVEDIKDYISGEETLTKEFMETNEGKRIVFEGKEQFNKIMRALLTQGKEVEMGDQEYGIIRVDSMDFLVEKAGDIEVGNEDMVEGLHETKREEVRHA